MARVRVAASWMLPVDGRVLQELGLLLHTILRWATAIEVEAADAEGFRVNVTLPPSMLPGLDYEREFVEALRELAEGLERVDVDVEVEGDGLQGV